MRASGSTLRIGFIGAGFSARLHAEAYHQVRGVDVTLTRVAAARPERAARFAEEFGVGAVAASAEEVLAASDVDVVDLCVPTSLHAPLAIKTARAGKHVIIEKPLTGCFAPPSTPRTEMLRRALADSDEIIAACQKAGVRLCYAENWVYAPPIQRARRLLTAAGGPILRIVGEESHGGTHAPMNKRWETGGGGSLIGKGCHPLGAALYLKADEGRRLRGRPVRPRAVMAETAQLTETDAFTAAGKPFLNTVPGADVEDWGTLLLTFDDGTVAQITGGDTVLGGIRNQLGIDAARATSRRASSRGSTRARTRSRRAAVPGLVPPMRRLGGRTDRADGAPWREELTGLASLRP